MNPENKVIGNEFDASIVKDAVKAADIKEIVIVDPGLKYMYAAAHGLIKQPEMPTKTVCLLRGCIKTTIHRGGYCCAEHKALHKIAAMKTAIGNTLPTYSYAIASQLEPVKYVSPKREYRRLHKLKQAANE